MKYPDEPGKWCIMWEMPSGKRGRGTAFMDKDRAQMIADNMNDATPGIKHWIEQAETPAPAGNPTAEAGE